MPRSIAQFRLEAPEAAGIEDDVCAATLKMRMLRTLVCGNKYEKAARAQGASCIAGVDEVGRGALFGPVVAAAVILPPDTRIRGLRDSSNWIAKTVSGWPRPLNAKRWPLPFTRLIRKPSTA